MSPLIPRFRNDPYTTVLVRVGSDYIQSPISTCIINNNDFDISEGLTN